MKGKMRTICCRDKAMSTAQRGWSDIDEEYSGRNAGIIETSTPDTCDKKILREATNAEGQ